MRIVRRVKGWRIEERYYHKQQACDCGKVIGRDGPMPHNRWHAHCDQHPDGARNRLLRDGVAEADLPIELMGQHVRDDVAPF